MSSIKFRPKTMSATLVTADDTLREVIRRMDWAALEIILVVNKEGALIGTITDGDIRRAILAGVALEQSAQMVMNHTPVAVSSHTPRVEMLKIMRRYSIRHLPVLDDEQRPVRLELLESFMPDSNALPNDSRAVIMAGGLGQRLRPWTETTPKPLLKIADQPIIDHILAGLRQYGIEDVVISVNYLGEHIRQHIGNGADRRLNVSYIDERQRLGTAGALSLLKPRPRQPFLVMNGDLLTNMNFTSLFRFQRKKHYDMVMCVRRYQTQIPYGVVEIESDHVRQLREKPTITHFINAGIYLIEPHCIDLIPENTYFDMTDLIRKILDNAGTVGAFPIVEYWRDIGNPDDFARANSETINQEAALGTDEESDRITSDVLSSFAAKMS